MTIRDNRSMNSDLARGAVDGKVRFLRPDSVDADETHARARAGVLHTQHYGSMGISANQIITIDDQRPDAAVAEVRFANQPSAIRTDVHATNVLPSFLAGA